MSIYAGIPSGAYNSEAAMLYGGLTMSDFNDPMTWNLLMPWFTRNGIDPQQADAITRIVTRYLAAATDWRLNRDPEYLVDFWREYAQLNPILRNDVRKAVNYIRRKKQVPLPVTSARLADAKTWEQALPYLRALPGIGKKFPTPVLDWLSLDDLDKEYRLKRWRQQVHEPSPMTEAEPLPVPYVKPTRHQLNMLRRRMEYADAFKRWRSSFNKLHPPIAREKKAPSQAAIDRMARLSDRRMGVLQAQAPEVTFGQEY